MLALSLLNHLKKEVSVLNQDKSKKISTIFDIKINESNLNHWKIFVKVDEKIIGKSYFILPESKGGRLKIETLINKSINKSGERLFHRVGTSLINVIKKVCLFYQCREIALIAVEIANPPENNDLVSFYEKNGFEDQGFGFMKWYSKLDSEE